MSRARIRGTRFGVDGGVERGFERNSYSIYIKALKEWVTISDRTQEQKDELVRAVEQVGGKFKYKRLDV